MFAEMLPLLVFTTFAGLAAGAYAVDALCGNGRAGSGTAAPARPWLFPLVCLVVRGNVPVDWYSTSPSRLSRWFQCALPGTSFDILQLTVQVWQPTQCWVSITMP